MKQHRATLAIYGIKDRTDGDNPMYTHDHNICLMQNGKILQYLHLERFTRKKYDNRLDLYIEALIDDNLLQLPPQFDIVSVNSFLGNSFISKYGKLRFESMPSNTLVADLEPAFAFYQYSKYNGLELQAFNCSQELAHIATCLPFFGNFKDNSLLIHFDGASSVSNFSAFVYKNKKLKLLEYNWDMKFIANFFNDNAFTFAILGANAHEHCSVPGKLMGYASLGQYNAKIEQWLIVNNYFSNYWNNLDGILVSIKECFDLIFAEIDNKTTFFQNVAATFQHIFERVLIDKISVLNRSCKADYLYYSGGCALNIVANTKIINKDIFKNVYIPPCCNDSGLSIGAAAFLEWKKGNKIEIHSPYLNNIGIELNSNKTENQAIEKVAKIILNGGIVGVFNGNGEVGPRSLGNRSLIALANCKQIAKKLSETVKKREWYRPVAPIMLTSIFNEVVHQDYHHLSKYMLLDFTIKKEFAKYFEGVIYLNNTARIQTLQSEVENPFMFNLLTLLKTNYNILGLINSSFNSQGEPIVHSETDALKSAKIMKIDGLVINNNFYEII